METIRELTHLPFDRPYLEKIQSNTILIQCPHADVPIGNSVGAIMKLEEKLGIDLTSDVEGASKPSSKL